MLNCTVSANWILNHTLSIHITQTHRVSALCKSIPAPATLLLLPLVRISEETGSEASFQQHAIHLREKLLVKLRKKKKKRKIMV